ncbi:MAG: four helix bundle protein [Victivallales bacterium]
MDNLDFKIMLEQRTLNFAIETVKFCMLLRQMNIPSALITQLLKAGTSIGGNYREANRAESKKDFIHKIGIVEKEASETTYWLEVLNGSKLLNTETLNTSNILLKEAKELLAIFNSISRNSKKKC